jgi:hypothetical protein
MCMTIHIRPLKKESISENVKNLMRDIKKGEKKLIKILKK